MPFTTVNQVITAPNDYWWSTRQTQIQQRVRQEYIENKLRWFSCLWSKPHVPIQRTPFIYHARCILLNCSGNLVYNHSCSLQRSCEEMNPQFVSYHPAQKVINIYKGNNGWQWTELRVSHLREVCSFVQPLLKHNENVKSKCWSY